MNGPVPPKGGIRRLVEPAGNFILCSLEVQGDEGSAAAPLLRFGPVDLVQQVVVQRRQQEAPEPAPSPIHVLQKVFFQEFREEPLRKVFARLDGIPLPTEEEVEGLPIGLNQ